MFSKTLLMSVSAGLLFALAGTVAQAQTSTTWTKGTAYLDNTNQANKFAISSGVGQSNSIVAIPNMAFKLSASYDSSLRQGANDASGAGPVFQKYIWNGGSVQAPLNYELDMGASASGMGSYQSTVDIHINFSPSGATMGGGGSAPPAYSQSPTIRLSDALAQGVGSVNGNAYLVAVHISGDARMYGSGNSSQAGATATFGNPF